MSDITLSTIARCLDRCPEILQTVNLSQLTGFVDLVRLLYPFLCSLRSAEDSAPPEHLPVNAHEFLKQTLDIGDETTKLLWTELRQPVWQAADPDDSDKFRQQMESRYLQAFLTNGHYRGISFHHFFPPTRVCLDPSCRQTVRGGGDILVGQSLVEQMTVSTTVFTQRHGPVPGLATSSYCRSCHTRYYPNYYVHGQMGNKKRTYYPQFPRYIQIATHVFMASSLCQLFTAMMLNAWTSATNCARIYNDGLADNDEMPQLPLSTAKSLSLDVNDVWTGLFLHWLIDDVADQRALDPSTPTLVLEHDAPSQDERLLPALRARNARMVGTGQEEWNHECDKCCWIHVDPKDESQTVLRSVVADGVTLGHPCCGVHDCTRPLNSVKDRFCEFHKSHSLQCAIVGCVAQVESGFKTCSLADHRGLETYLDERNHTMFQLKRRLERLKITQPDDAMADVISSSSNDPETILHADEEVEVAADLSTSSVDSSSTSVLPTAEIEDGADECEGKSEQGNKKLRARFGRRRTHNEELCVTSCGVILGRATMFGSEAPNGVRLFLMGLFPTKASLLGVIWHDNNCRIMRMLAGDTNPHLKNYFEHCALPVDVFHFKCKHKVSDEQCNAECNPYLWKELRTDDGKWRFNSSAAEQTNAWFGGYQSIVREMQVDRYNFFLDEMIKRRNRKIVTELRQKMHAPYHIP